MKIYYDSYDNKYYLKTPKGMSLKDIINDINKNNDMIKDSFADKYSKNIIFDILNGAIDLENKYSKYYFEEYNSFKEYLYKKELISFDFLLQLNLNINEALWLLDIHGNNYNITGLLEYYDENTNILKIINNILENIKL